MTAPVLPWPRIEPPASGRVGRSMARLCITRSVDGQVAVTPPDSLSAAQRTIIGILIGLCVALGVLSIMFLRADQQLWTLGPLTIGALSIGIMPKIRLSIGQAKGPVLVFSPATGEIEFPRINLAVPLDTVHDFACVSGWYHYEGGGEVQWLATEQLYVAVRHADMLVHHMIWQGASLPDPVHQVILEDIHKPIDRHRCTRDQAATVTGITMGI